MEEKKKNQSKEKRNLKLSTKMSLILGLISALAFLFYGIVLIHYSKTYVDKMIDGNMVDKSHMAMNDVDNILVNAETSAETIKDSVTASYEADQDYSNGSRRFPVEGEECGSHKESVCGRECPD